MLAVNVSVSYLLIARSHTVSTLWLLFDYKLWQVRIGTITPLFTRSLVDNIIVIRKRFPR